MGGDLVYIVSKNALFAGPNNVAYGASKADQAHQVRLLAAELGQYGIRVNGVNPDGVVRGSGIFAKGWGADRARTYGIPEDKLGEFYAQRTLLKREVLPGARRRGGLRPDRRRPQPDHRPAHPGRRGCGGGLPPVTGRLVAAVDLGASSGRVMVGRVAPNELELTEVHRFPNEPVRLPDGLHWDILRLYREVLAGPARGGPGGRRRSSASASTRGPSTTACSTRPAACSGDPFHYRDDRTAPAGRDRSTTSSRRPSSTPGPASSSCRSTRSTSSPRPAARPAFAAARTMLLIPDLLGYWLTGRARRRGHERLDDRAAGRPPADVGRRARSRSLGDPAGALPAARRSRRRGRAAAGGRAPRDRRWRRRRCSRSSGRTTRPRRSSASRPPTRRSPTSRAARGRSSASSSSTPILTEEGRRGELHQRGRRRRADPLPAQRHGPVAAPGVAPDVGARGARRSSCRRCSSARPSCRPAARSSTRTTRRSCRPATCRPGSRPPASRARPAGAGRHARPLVRCILDSLAAAYGADGPRRRATVRPVRCEVVHLVGGGARNALLCQLTADACEAAGGRRPGRGDRARQRARPGPGARAASPATSRRCGRSSGRPRTSGATSRGRRSPGAEPDRMRVALFITCYNDAAVPGGRPGDRAAAPAARPRGRVPGRRRRAAARCTSTPATRTRACRSSSASSTRSRATTRSSRRPARAPRWSATTTRSWRSWRPSAASDPGLAERVADGRAARPRAERVPRRRPRRHRRRGPLPAHGRLPPDLPLDAAARRRRPADAAARGGRGPDPRRPAAIRRRAAGSAARSR